MKAIKIPSNIDKKDWAEMWNALFEYGSVTRISKEYIYLLNDKQIELLRKKNFPFEEVDSSTSGGLGGLVGAPVSKKV